MYVNTEIVEKYQEFFDFMSQENDLIVTHKLHYFTNIIINSALFIHKNLELLEKWKWAWFIHGAKRYDKHKPYKNPQGNTNYP